MVFDRKEYDKQRYKENKEHLKEQQKQWNHTPAGKKSKKISIWPGINSWIRHGDES